MSHFCTGVMTQLTSLLSSWSTFITAITAELSTLQIMLLHMFLKRIKFGTPLEGLTQHLEYKIIHVQAKREVIIVESVKCII